MFEIPEIEEAAATRPRPANPCRCVWGGFADVVPRRIDGLDLPLRLAVVGLNLATVAMLANPFVALALSLGFDGRSPATRRGDD
jgi:hypothetical protein